MGAALTGEVAERLIKDYLSAPLTSVTFLPSERELMSRLEVSRTTIRRALQALEADGWIRAEQGRGYRRLARYEGLGAGSRIAVLRPQEHQGISDELARSLQNFALQRGAQLLSLGPALNSPDDMVHALRQASVWGTVITLDDPRIHRKVAEAGLPCVAVDYPGRQSPIDCIKQDSFGGAQMAADYLLDKGHRRVSWFGPVRATAHSLERFSGAHSAFLARGLEWPKALIPEPAADLLAAARELLTAPQPPSAVLALWAGYAQAIAKAALELGLKLGRDLDLVGWADDHQYQTLFALTFASTGPFPMVTWNIDELASVAISRLTMRQKEPHLKPLLIAVPCQLHLP